MFNSIYQFFTKKEINNQETLINYKSPKEEFLSNANLAKLASTMYRKLPVELKNNYFIYKEKIYPYMKKWIISKHIDAEDIKPNIVNISELNNNFIKDNKFLYELPLVKMDQTGNITPVIQNVWKKKIELNEYDYDNNKIKTTYKSSSNLMPDDYGKLDLWEEDNTYFDYDFVHKWKSFRQWGHANPIIPRHVDRSNEGLQSRDSNRASLEQPQRNYDMSEWYRAKNI
jgi:hypothetical protein